MTGNELIRLIARFKAQTAAYGVELKLNGGSISELKEKIWSHFTYEEKMVLEVYEEELNKEVDRVVSPAGLVVIQNMGMPTVGSNN